MAQDILILAATAAGLLLFLSPRLRQAPGWRAMVTPLASIIGSGFLVLGPVLNDAFGSLALPVMAVLCLVAWLLGAAIRRNIATLDSGAPPPGRMALEALADWALAFAYVISVAYYLNLFGAFALGLWPDAPPVWARGVTSAVYAVILAVGWSRGFAALERMEIFSVSLKLAIILGLLSGLAVHAGGLALAGGLVAAPPQVGGWEAVTLVFGLIVTVQGFETTRYLGAEYPADLRIRAMRHAQWASTAIYLVYVALLCVTFAPGSGPAEETAIIGLMARVSPVLPYMLVVSALAAQFSAAVADTAGAGGLVAGRSRGRLGSRGSYALLVGAGLALTWTTDVFGIIAYASRAFAFYYALECAIAALVDRKAQPARAAGYAALAILALAMAIFGRPVE